MKEKVAGPEGHTMMYELAERALDESISGKLKDCISQVGKDHRVMSLLRLLLYHIKSTHKNQHQRWHVMFDI
jgi:hypothetical protein